MADLLKGTVLPIGERVIALMNNGEFTEQAEAMAKTAKKNGRSLATVTEHFLIGFAIERAFLEYLPVLGFTVLAPPPNVKQYDGIVNGWFVDVKTRLDGRTWEQSPWENAKLKETGERVAYLCIDVMPNGDFIFRGYSWSDELAPSHYGAPFVQLGRLKDLSEFGA